MSRVAIITINRIAIITSNRILIITINPGCRYDLAR